MIGRLKEILEEIFPHLPAIRKREATPAGAFYFLPSALFWLVVLVGLSGGAFFPEAVYKGVFVAGLLGYLFGSAPEYKRNAKALLVSAFALTLWLALFIAGFFFFVAEPGLINFIPVLAGVWSHLGLAVMSDRPFRVPALAGINLGCLILLCGEAVF